MAVGTTFDSNVTRNELITLAFQEVNMLELNAALDVDRLAWGIKRLNIILRRLDAEKKHIWTVSATPSVVSLVANTFLYTSSNGLPTNIKRLVGVNYRDTAGHDTPLRIYTPEIFMGITDKFVTGKPEGILLTEHRDVGSQTLHVWPTLSTISAVSEVTGTDALNYTCIRAHQSTSTATNKPITGADYLLYWEQTGSAGAAWAAGSSYTAAEHLRLWYERPLFDFDSSSDNPDVPNEWIESLLYEMVMAITNGGAFTVEDRTFYSQKTAGSRKKIFPSQNHHSSELINKRKFF